MGRKWRMFSGSVLASGLIISSAGFTQNVNAEDGSSVEVLTVQDQSGDKMTVDATNQLVNDNRLVVFNDSFSYYTETQKGSIEVVLEKDGLNTYRVKEDTNGDSPIPENGIVLSTGVVTKPEIRNFLNQLKEGETVKLLEPTEKREQMQANSVDPTRESNPTGAPFDGFRGPDQLIVYTPSFDETTKTNPYGYEITVENGFVTKLGGGGPRFPITVL